MRSSAPQPIVITGHSGLIGSKFVADFQESYEFVTLDVNAAEPVDITNLSSVTKAFENTPAAFVVHCAAYTNVTEAWKQTGDKKGPAYQVNVVGTENIVKAAETTGKHVIHLSTSYVFNGEKKDRYLETDAPAPLEWYGHTKVWAEEAVMNGQAPWTILRLDQPFRSDAFARPDIVRKIVLGLTEDNLNPQFADHYFGPTFIDDFARVIDWVIRSGTTGLFHASTGEQWSDYEFALALKEKFDLGGRVDKGSLTEYLKTSQRPYQRNSALNCDKLKSQLDFSLLSVDEALDRVVI